MTTVAGTQRASQPPPERKPSAMGVGGWDTGDDHEFYGNVVFRNGWNTLDHGFYSQNTGAHTAKRYVVYGDDYAALNTGGRTAQKGFTFLADDADRQIQDLIAARKWGGGTPDGVAADPSAAVSLRRVPQLSYTEGEPATVALWRALAEGVNCLKANVCNQEPIADLWSANRAITGTTYGLVAGPYPVFIPPGAHSLTFKVWAYVAAGTGTVRISAAHSMPGGTVAAPTWGADVVTATGTTTATGAPAEVEIVLPLTSPSLRTVWVGVEAKNSAANATNVRGVVANFAPIPLV